jgi:hypothetical protein
VTAFGTLPDGREHHLRQQPADSHGRENGMVVRYAFPRPRGGLTITGEALMPRHLRSLATALRTCHSSGRKNGRGDWYHLRGPANRALGHLACVRRSDVQVCLATRTLPVDHLIIHRGSFITLNTVVQLW